MTDRLAIPLGPDRVLWVFAVDLPETGARHLLQAGLDKALGVTPVDTTKVELIDTEAFVEYGLARYLAEGQGMDEAGLAPDTARLDALRGPVLLVHRAALPQGLGTPGHLSPQAPLRLIGRYSELPPPPPMAMTGYDAAADTIVVPGKKAPSEAAMSGRVAMVVLILLAIFVTLFVWGAG